MNYAFCSCWHPLLLLFILPHTTFSRAHSHIVFCLQFMCVCVALMRILDNGHPAAQFCRMRWYSKCTQDVTIVANRVTCRSVHTPHKHRIRTSYPHIAEQTSIVCGYVTSASNWCKLNSNLYFVCNLNAIVSVARICSFDFGLIVWSRDSVLMHVAVILFPFADRSFDIPAWSLH